MTINKAIVLDTTYILPIFGIKVELSPAFKSELVKVLANTFQNYDLYLPSICLIEVSYKLNREYRQRVDIEILNRYPILLPTILNSSLKIFNPQLDVNASLVAMKIRHKGHTDLMDCWIAAAAVALNGILVTEDKPLKEMLQTIPETKDIDIYSWNDFIERIFKKI